MRKMMQHKRSPISLEQNSFMDLMPKRLKTDVPLSSKEKKEKISERISAIQQLVSPYGKTDTASVLLVAMEYIRFLHEQLKEVEPCSSLKAKGLCLVPISFIDGVSSSNGADIWAPIKTIPSTSSGLISDDASVITGHS